MKDLKNYEDSYEISEFGEIYSKEKICHNPRYGTYTQKRFKVKQTIKKGYLTCVINGRIKPVHRLLYETFVGNIPKGCILHHKNENKLDNRIENLVVMSRSSHIEHHNHVGNIYGKRKTDLSKSQIDSIINLWAEGLSTRKIAELVGCGKSTVQRVCAKHKEALKV